MLQPILCEPGEKNTNTQHWLRAACKYCGKASGKDFWLLPNEWIFQRWEWKRYRYFAPWEKAKSEQLAADILQDEAGKSMWMLINYTLSDLHVWAGQIEKGPEKRLSGEYCFRIY